MSSSPAFEGLEPRLLLTTTYIVNSLSDTVAEDGVMTLREALQAANTDLAVHEAAPGSGADVIEFASDLFAGGPRTITLSGTELAITAPLAIRGPGADLLTLDACGLSRVFTVGVGATASIDSVTIAGGAGPSGGGVRNDGVLTLNAVAIRDNTAGLEGGGIYNARNATLTLVNSALWGNTASYYGGGIRSLGTATIANTTLSGNSSEQFGGGVFSSGLLTVVNATVTANRADAQGAGFGLGGGIGIGAGSATLYNTIVSGNFVGAGTDPGDVYGAFRTSGTCNLIGVVDGSTGLSGGAGTLSGTAAVPLDALLGPLTDNGGPTPSHALSPGSPAYDAGSNAQAVAAGLTTDQRGGDFPRMLYGTVDIGAVECIRGGSIGDRVWNDADADGTQDGGENGIDGVTLRLYRDDGDGTFEPGSDDALVGTRLTAGGGLYDFVNLDVGDYWVEVDSASAPLAGFTGIGLASPLAVTLTPSQDYNDADFGYCGHLFVVSTLADESDGDYSAGDLSLREALTLAKNSAGFDIITFAPSLNGGTILLNSSLGMLSVDQSLEMRGPGQGLLTLDAQGACTVLGVWAEHVVLSGFTVSHGMGSGGAGGITIGSSAQGTVDIRDVAFYANSLAYSLSPRGGAGLGVGSATVSVSNCRFSLNTGGSWCFGMGLSNGGVMTLSDCTFEDNQSSGEWSRGGAIYNVGTLTIERCQVLRSSLSSYGSGGAIYSSGTLTMRDSTIADSVNNTNGAGAGLFLSGGITTLSRTTIRGGFAWSSAGVNLGNMGTLVMTDCTISGNRSGNLGSALTVSGFCNAVLTNCTISGNSSNWTGGQLAAIYNEGSLMLTQCTVTGNSVSGSGTQCGGILNSPSANPPGVVLLNNTIVAGNIGNLDVSGAFATASSHNLIGAIDGSSGLTGNSTVYGTAAKPLDLWMGSLQDNGGPVFTCALVGEGPAVDAGDSSLAVDAAGHPLTTDARGEMRIADGDLNGSAVVDIGAFERNAGDIADDRDGGYGYYEHQFVVSTLADENDGDYRTGDFSLREALVAAKRNDSGVPDVITFDPSLNGGTITISPSLGRLVIDSNVEIRGPGKGLLTLDANNACGVLGINSNLTVTVSGLTLTRGASEGAGNSPGLNIRGGCTVSLADMAFSRNFTAASGEAGGGMKVAAGSTVTVTHSDFTMNVSGGGGDVGGAIYSAGSLTLTDCTLDANVGESNGGAIYSTGDLTVARCTLRGNTAAGGGKSGGGIYFKGARLTVSDSLLSDNVINGSISGSGAGIAADGVVTITNTTLRNNRGGFVGGGLILGGTVLISDCTLSGNSAAYQGGGLYLEADYTVATVVNCTFSGNYSYLSGGVYNSGKGSVLTMTNCTVTGNSASYETGGIFSNSSGTNPPSVLRLNNTIVAGNLQGATPSDVSGAFDAASSHNLIGAIDGSSGLTGNGTVYGTAAQPLDLWMGPLQDNGGPVYTCALIGKGPAVDAGDNLLAVVATGHPLTTDARGEVRVWDGDLNGSAIVDIGAFERNSDDVSSDRDGGYGYYDHQYVVSALTDENDGDYRAGHFSLREALAAAKRNDRSAPDVITFDPSLNGGTILLNPTLGRLVIDSNVEIHGPGKDLLTLDGNRACGIFSLSNGLTLSLSGLSLARGVGFGGAINIGTGCTADLDHLGFVGNAIGDYQKGGALYVQSGSIVTLRDSGISLGMDNGTGGNGYGIAIANEGSLTVSDCTIEDIQRTSDAGGVFGGAFYSTGQLTIVRTRIARVTTPSYLFGGGIYASGQLTASDVVISDVITGLGHAGDGGVGIYVTDCVASITNTTIQNCVGSWGGGIYLTGMTSATLTDCTISGNQVGYNGGGVEIGGNLTAATLVNCTISGNTCSLWAGGKGGGVYNQGNLVLTQCTVSDNVVTPNGTPDGGGLYAFGGGSPPAVTRLNNTIVARNLLGTTPDDVCGAFDAASSHNLIGTGDGATGFINRVNDNLVGTNAALIDPWMGLLQDNGGPVFTCALIGKGPAVDAGDNSLAVDGAGHPLTADARGFVRIADGDLNGSALVDIGAFERNLGDIGDDHDGGYGYHDHAFVVSTLADENDGDYRAGDFSLREALVAANRNDRSVPDVITFAPSLTGGTILLDSSLGRLVIDSNVVISGPGRDLLTLDANNACGILGVSGNLNVTLSGLMITRGSGSGGGLHVGSGCTVGIHDLSFSRNTASASYQYGIGLLVDAGSTVTVSNSVFSRNQCGGSSAGAAVYNYGDLTLSDDSFEDNQTGDACEGGAIYTRGRLTVVRCNIERTRMGAWCNAAGIFVYRGQLSVSDSTISDGIAHGTAGGIFTLDSLVSVTNTIIRSNTCDSGAGVAFNGTTEAMMTGCTVSGNVGGDAGGVWVGLDAVVSLVNCTIAGNTSSHLGGGIQNNGTLTLIHCTIVGNRVVNGSDGGGIYHISSTTPPNSIKLFNTIVADNLLGQSPDDVAGVFDPASSHNLIGAGDGATGLINGVNGNLVGTDASPIDPQLGPLADHYGPTWTCALLLGSPAEDAGDSALAVDSDGHPLATDQRGPGFPRIVGPAVDIGAYELSGGASIGDRVWSDGNANGIVEPGEAGLDGATVRLYVEDGDGVFEGGGQDAFIAARQTISGGYVFTGLVPGDYWIQVDESAGPLAGYLRSTESNPRLVHLGTDQQYDTADFGYYRPIVVSTLADETDGNTSAGHLSLREALAIAKSRLGFDILCFEAALTGGTIRLDSGRGQVVVDSDVEIRGPQGGNVVIDAGGHSRALYVESGVMATISRLTLTGGSTYQGAGLYLSFGSSVTAIGLKATGNTASYRGGGVFVSYQSELILSDSTLDVNSAGSQGGGLYLDFGGQATVTHVTISRNTAGNDGGGIYSDGILSAGNLTVSGNRANRYGGAIAGDMGNMTLVNATVADNRADANGDGVGDGGGLHVGDGIARLDNTIVAGNVRGAAMGQDVSGLLAAGSSHNILGVGGGGLTNGSDGNRAGSPSQPLDVRLMPLGDYGGTTQTHALFLDSPALEAGSNAVAAGAGLTTDQSGLARIRDYDSDGAATVDIGAYEANPLIAVTALNDELADTDGKVSIREALAIAAAREGFDVIRFDANLFVAPGVVVLSHGELTADSDLYLYGPGARSLTVDAAHAGRAFGVEAGTRVFFEGLTIADGLADFGGGIRNRGESTLVGVELRDCAATASGGGIWSDGTLTFSASTLADNSAGLDGGGLYADGTATTAVNSTISGNAANQGGGGIYVANGLLLGVNLTIADNLADADVNGSGDGGGVQVSSGTATFHNSVLAGNLRGASSDDAAGDFSPEGSYNLVGVIDGSTGLDAGAGTQYGVALAPLDAMLQPLGDNGGQVRTHAIRPASPVLDAGDNSRAIAAGLAADQRGLDRFKDGRDTGMAVVDIGAFEQQVRLNIAPTLTRVDPLNGAVENLPFTITYEALRNASDAHDADGDPVSFLIVGQGPGRLQHGGADVVLGQTVLKPGESLVWTPPGDTSGDIHDVLTVKAWDEQAESLTPIGVDVEVTPAGRAVNYAVLFSGGDSPSKNFPRYYNDLKDLYQTLVTTWHVKPYNIYVVYADGRAAGADQPDGRNSDMSFAVNVLPGTRANLQSTLAEVARIADSNDHLFFWTYDHGVGNTDPAVTGEEVLKGWGDVITDADLAAWLTPVNSRIGFSTSIFTQCFSGGMLDNLGALGGTRFGAAAATHYEESYGDAFTVAFTEALKRGYGNTLDAFAYAFNNDSNATDGQGPGGDRAYGVEHPWALGGSFQIFAPDESGNSTPVMTNVWPIKGDAAANDLDITYDMLMAASGAYDPDGEAIVFGIQSVNIGTLSKGGAVIPTNPDHTVATPTDLRYGQKVTWHRTSGSPGQIMNAFKVVLMDNGAATGSPQTVPIRLGPPTGGPVAVPDDEILQRNTQDVLINVLANDQFATGTEIVSLGVPSHGTVRLDQGQVLYTPTAGFRGPDAFSYVLKGASGVTDMATVSVNVVDYDPGVNSDTLLYTVTEMPAPPGWLGMPETWTWAQRENLPPWTQVVGLDLAENGYASVEVLRQDPGDKSLWYIGGPKASYMWSPSFGAPDWNPSGGNVSTNVWMYLNETNRDMPDDETGRFIVDGGIVPSLLGLDGARLPVIEYTAPRNAYEPYPPVGAWIEAPGQATEMWHNVPDFVYPVEITTTGKAASNATDWMGSAQRGSMWDLAGSWDNRTDLTGWGGYYRVGVEAMNNQGQTVGLAEFTEDVYHAFLYSALPNDAPGMIDLGTLPGDTQSRAYGVNGSGQVVGTSGASRTDPGMAFLWSSGSMGPLGVLPGQVGGWSEALDINDSGMVVGRSSVAGGGSHAFLYADGQMYDLNSLVPGNYTLTGAVAINNAGQILAVDDSVAGHARTFYLDVGRPGISAGDDYLTVPSDGPTIISGANLLANDSPSVEIAACKKNDGSKGELPHTPGYASITYDPRLTFGVVPEGETRTDSFTYTVRDSFGHSASATVHITVIGVSPLQTLHVAGFSGTPTGFEAQLGGPAGLTDLSLDLNALNLYDGQDASVDLPDVTVTGSSTGPVRGSLFWDAAAKTLIFVATGGPLAPDTYSVTLSGRSNGVASTTLGALDGDGNNVAGGDYSDQFTVAPTSARVVSLPDFARGPGQAVDVPVRITDTSGLVGVDFRLEWDPALLHVTSVTPSGALAAAGWTAIPNVGSGFVTVSLSRVGTSLPAGPMDLVIVHGEVPAEAPYRAGHLVKICQLSLNEGSIPAVADTAVAKVAFPGDVSGNARYWGMDAPLLARVAVGLDSGFDAYLTTDPRIVGDVTGDGTISGMDTSNVAEATIGLPVATIPALPATLPPVVAGGTDPIVSIPSAGAQPGQASTLPVSVDDASGLQAARLVIRYDTTVFDEMAADVSLGGLVSTLTGTAAWSLFKNVDDAAGVMTLLAFSAVPLSGGQGPLLQIAWHVRSDARAGSYALDLDDAQSYLNGGGLALTAQDGAVTIGTPNLPGDANSDGIVDQADYTLWYNSYGATGRDLPADFTADGLVDQADYTVWYNNYGTSLPILSPMAEGSCGADLVLMAATDTASTAPAQPEISLLAGSADVGGSALMSFAQSRSSVAVTASDVEIEIDVLAIRSAAPVAAPAETAGRTMAEAAAGASWMVGGPDGALDLMASLRPALDIKDLLKVI